METPFDYDGRTDTCTGCADVVHAGDMVVPVTEDRPDRLLCIACWWFLAAGLALPAWARGGMGPT